MDNIEEVLKNISLRNENIVKALENRRLLKDIRGGRDALIKNKRFNIPMFPHESDEDYKTRLNYAYLYNILGKNVNDSGSKILKKRFGLESTGDNEDDAEFIKDLRSNFNGFGSSIEEFLKSVIIDSLWYSQAHIFVDYDTYEDIDNKKKGVHMVSIIDIENILDFEYKYNDLTYLRLYIIKEIRVNRKIEKKCFIKEYEKINGVVTWNEYESIQPIDENFNIENTVFKVSLSNQPFDLPYIPLLSFYTDSCSSRFNPDLKFRDVATIQLAHFQTVSEKRFLEGITLKPKMIVKGLQDGDIDDGNINNSASINRSSGMALAVSEQGGDVKWLLPPQDGSKSFNDTLNMLSEEIQTMTDSLLTRRGTITATEVAISESNSNSTLASIASGFKTSIADAAINTIMDWKGVDVEYTSSINTDFSFDIDPVNSIDLLKASLDANVISKDVFFEEIKRRGVINDNLLYDTVKEQVLSDNEIFPKDTFLGV